MGIKFVKFVAKKKETNVRQLVIKPDGWPCTLAECPPGLFIFDAADYQTLGFKSEYGVDNPYIIDGGEVFWGGVNTKEARGKLPVQPCQAVWIDDDFD